MRLILRDIESLRAHIESVDEKVEKRTLEYEERVTRLTERQNRVMDIVVPANSVNLRGTVEHNIDMLHALDDRVTLVEKRQDNFNQWILYGVVVWFATILGVISTFIFHIK